MKKHCTFLLLSILTTLPIRAEPIKIAITMIELPAEQILPADPAEVLKLKAITTRTLPPVNAISGHKVTIKDVKQIKANSTLEMGVIFHILPRLQRDRVLFKLDPQVISFERYVSSFRIGQPSHPAEITESFFSTRRMDALLATVPLDAPCVVFVTERTSKMHRREKTKLSAIDKLLNSETQIATVLYAIITFTKG